ncbi:HNH endonuclease signature motif containing protein [Geodermatophilus chilensis]|uniref:HNH endonuclease signature motif containing protein n=1 Tax=Geodermatophilus chilensis TaxID=2035835 RepID=UPI0012FFEFD9|nr:HNH endonuclease signature motif containing protein [Geodermatophilus chilensis]
MGSSGDLASGLTVAQLAREITAGAVRLAAATAAWLCLVAEFDRRQGWGEYGICSCAHWLAWQCGMGPGTAREHVRVARALPRLPLIGEAFATGRLSYSKVRALTRVAEPGTEAALLDFALEATASQTERVVRQWRRADAVDDGTVAERRRFDTWTDEAGMLVLQVRVPAEEGADLLASVDSLAERAARRDRAARKRSAGAAGRAPTEDTDDCSAEEPSGVTAARRCAALRQLARAAVRTDRRTGDPPRREVVVHVDAALLDDDTAAGRAYLEGGPALHPAQVRRMLCEATVVTMLERDREPLAVGRRRRRATAAQRLALLRRDGGCARPGCPETRIERLHAHHMRHWRHGGRTDLANLVLLCDADHGVVHDLELVMTHRDGRLVVTAPDGRRVWGPSDAAFTTGLPDPAGRAEPDTADAFVGVHPIDQHAARRPDTPRGSAGPPAPAAGRRPVDRRPQRSTGPVGPGRRSGIARRVRSAPVTPAAPATVGGILGLDGSPALPDAMHVNGERMDVGYVVSVLMGHRDFVRHLEVEAGLASAG